MDKFGCERILGPGITGDQIFMSIALLGCYEPLNTFNYIEVLSDPVLDKIFLPQERRIGDRMVQQQSTVSPADGLISI